MRGQQSSPLNDTVNVSSTAGCLTKVITDVSALSLEKKHYLLEEFLFDTIQTIIVSNEITVKIYILQQFRYIFYKISLSYNVASNTDPGLYTTLTASHSEVHNLIFN